jgi:hypothetical protein
MLEGVKALLRGKKMAEESKEQSAKDAALEDLSKPAKKKRGPGRPKGSGKRGRPKGSKNKKKGKPGRPRKVATEGVKRGPGRPKGPGKGKPGRPRGKRRGRKPGSINGAIPKGYVKISQARRIAKDAVAKVKAGLPKLIRKELLKLLR